MARTGRHHDRGTLEVEGKRGATPLSDDRFDKFVAAMNWYVGRHKGDPEFGRSPHYYAAVSEWFDRLPLDDQERVHIVVHA